MDFILIQRRRTEVLSLLFTFWIKSYTNRSETYDTFMTIAVYYAKGPDIHKVIKVGQH